MRVSTLSGRPPDNTSSAGAVCSISTARSSFWPIPIVGRCLPITSSTTASMTLPSAAIASISSSSSTEPDTSAAANGGVFLQTGSWLTPLARIRSIAARTVSAGPT